MALPEPSFQLQPENYALFLGSCFAQHVGEALSADMPEAHVGVNPFGVLYNPLSIASALQMLLDENPRLDDIFLGHDNLFHSPHCSGTLSAETREACQRNVEKAFEQATALLAKADVIAITLGTAHVYESKASGMVVANCHKEPASAFRERRANVAEIANVFSAMLKRLAERRPNAHVVFTISPYRYAKLGMHGNTLSKATLHLAIEALAETWLSTSPRKGGLSYFPAYEIVLDELRDYRFFEADMLHPSAVATNYVYEQFAAWAFSDALRDFANDKRKLVALQRHRPLHGDVSLHEARISSARQALLDKWGLA